MESRSNPRVDLVPVARHLCVFSELSHRFKSHFLPACESRDDEGDDDISTFDDGSWRGNKRRKLWKSACIHGALNVGEGS